MPKTSWPTPAPNQPGGRLSTWHLVVATLPADTVPEIGTRHVTNLRGALGRFLTGLPLAGDYALRIDRTSGAAEIHVALEQKADADRIAEALHARDIDRYPGWSSQRSFLLDEQALGRAGT